VAQAPSSKLIHNLHEGILVTMPVTGCAAILPVPKAIIENGCGAGWQSELDPGCEDRFANAARGMNNDGPISCINDGLE
jgi:hypothetical protein